MGLEAGDNPKYQIGEVDAQLIKAYQVCKEFHCLDINVYRGNPVWWNSLCFALMRTENKAQEDKQSG